MIAHLEGWTSHKTVCTDGLSWLGSVPSRMSERSHGLVLVLLLPLVRADFRFPEIELDGAGRRSLDGQHIPGDVTTNTKITVRGPQQIRGR